MDTYDEWYYSVLLDLFKEKERNDTYKQIELELPLPLEQAPEIKHEEIKDNVERGVIIIEM